MPRIMALAAGYRRNGDEPRRFGRAGMLDRGFFSFGRGQREKAGAGSFRICPKISEMRLPLWAGGNGEVWETV
jgi:hypothetical protein